MDKISVIIPIFNNEKFLEKCLLSVQKQTFSNIEVVMVNDGSTDGCEEICLRFAKDDARFKYIYQDNSGVSAARNAGLEVASGNYIGFVDSDDWIDEDMYESLYNLLKTQDADVAIESFFFDADGSVKSIKNNEQICVYDSDASIKELLQGPNFNGELCNKLFKRKLFDGIRFEKDIFTSEDLVAVCEIFCCSNKIVFQDVHKYHYVYNTQSACHSKFNEKRWSLQLACRRIVSILEKYSPNNIAYAQKYLINGNLSLATDLCAVKGLNRENYLRIKQEIKPYKNKASVRLLQKKTKISLIIFMRGRRLYALYRSLINQTRKG